MCGLRSHRRGAAFRHHVYLITGASVYADGRLPMVIAVASLSTVILGLQSMKATLHSRDLNLRPLTYIELISQITTLSVSTVTAYLTHSVWAFVAGGLASSAVTTPLSHVWLPAPKDRMGWNAEALRDLRHFGKWAFLFFDCPCVFHERRPPASRPLAHADASRILLHRGRPRDNGRRNRKPTVFESFFSRTQRGRAERSLTFFTALFSDAMDLGRRIRLDSWLSLPQRT